MKRWLEGPVGRGRGVLLIIAAGGLVALLVAGLDYHFITKTQAKFTQISCYIEDCRMIREAGRDDRNLPGWQYVPVVSYKYTVNEQEYASTVVCSRHTPIVTLSASDAFMKKFGPGADATCFVNPDDATDAMLELPTLGQSERFAKFGGFALALAIVGLIALQVMTMIDTAPKLPPPMRAPGWGEIDSGPDDALARTRQILRERLES